MANMIGGNADAGSVYRAKRHTFPLQPDLVRETGSSWWQARLGALLCPQPRLPASVALQAGLLTGPQVIDKKIMKTNKACLLSPHGDVAPCCWTHHYSRPTCSCMCISNACQMMPWIGHCQMNVFSPYSVYKGVSISIPAFELRLNMQALWECRMVLAQYGSKPSQRHRG